MKRTVTGAVSSAASPGRIASAVIAVLAALGLTACGGAANPLSSNAGGGASSAPDTITIGSANFPESRLLAQIYATALTARGVKTTLKPNIGSREVYLPALKDGSIDLIPEYTGTLLQYLDKTAPQTSSEDVYAALPKALPPGLTVLDKATAEDKDAVVVSAATAQKFNLKSIADLAPHCAELTMGGPPEFQTRPDGLPGLTKNYGCTFKGYKSLDAGGPLTVAAVKDGTADAADLFTTDSSIAANNFVVLADPKSNFAAQNVVPLINAKKANDTVKQTLNAISAKLDTKALADLDARLSAPDHPDAAAVAKDWLASVGLG
ncbi:ABC transporter substrate-binding protein [Gandjariella thermophila]|uniref:Glycine/betaine ABC transporter substrate-binding protein n=1 Tax=Gandjariella thermophila TaxID=1931992 RepID=A0A4D4J408_9PSEU|nr:ABC transporter substrate-binding protein [Gandjariella thermophila]GDY31251.1 glycine/betaine ABC transporter substrate-binding protein [Gandjariella thermophila]